MNSSSTGVPSRVFWKPEDIVPAIKRGIQKTLEGAPVLLEFMTSKETRASRL